MDYDSEITSLKSRMDYQEKIHPDITMTAPGMIHGLMRMWPYFMFGMVVLGISTIVVLNQAKKIKQG